MEATSAALIAGLLAFSSAWVRAGNPAVKEGHMIGNMRVAFAAVLAIFVFAVAIDGSGPAQAAEQDLRPPCPGGRQPVSVGVRVTDELDLNSSDVMLNVLDLGRGPFRSANGNFALVLCPGQYRYAVDASQMTFTNGVFTVRDLPQQQEVRITGNRTFDIRGRVTTFNGQVPNTPMLVVVSILNPTVQNPRISNAIQRSPGGVHGIIVGTGGNGTFSILGALNRADYAFAVEYTRRILGQTEEPRVVRFPHLTINNRGPNARNVDVTLPMPAGQIRGFLKTDQGTGLSNVRVMAMRARTNGPSRAASTRDDGGFTIQDAPPGNYTLSWDPSLGLEAVGNVPEAYIDIDDWDFGVIRVVQVVPSVLGSDVRTEVEPRHRMSSQQAEALLRSKRFRVDMRRVRTNDPGAVGKPLRQNPVYNSRVRPFTQVVLDIGIPGDDLVAMPALIGSAYIGPGVGAYGVLVQSHGFAIDVRRVPNADRSSWGVIASQRPAPGTWLHRIRDRNSIALTVWAPVNCVGRQPHPASCVLNPLR